MVKIPTTIHGLPPELIRQILSNLSSVSTATTPSTDADAPLPSAFDQFPIYGAFASASRQLYEITVPFLYSSLTVNAIINNIGTDHHQHTPIAYHGVRDPELQCSLRSLKEVVTARDSESTRGRGPSGRMRMCSYIKSVTLVFVNQQTTRPGLFRAPHCQACTMSQEEVDAARPLAKADFDEYIESMPAARAALADLVTILGRLDRLESFAVLKRRNRRTEPQWECEPVNLDGWVDVRDDGYADGLEELSKGMVEQIVRLCNLPTLRRLDMNCRIPSFVWMCNPGLEYVRVKGMFGDSALQASGKGWGEKWSRWDDFSSVQEVRCESRSEGGARRSMVCRRVDFEVAADGSEGMVALVDRVADTISERVQVAKFDIRYRGKGNQRAVESWLYRFLALSAETLEQLDVAAEELPKICSTDSVPFESIPTLPLLRRIHISFKTDIRRPRVWKRVATLLQPILDSAPSVSELSLEMVEPGHHDWDPGHCDKTFKLIEELDEVLGGAFTQHASIREVNVRVEHNCSRWHWCNKRVGRGDWFRLAKEMKRAVVIKLEKRV